MKLECSGEKIKSAILQADRITAKNVTLPILNSILLIASGKTLKIRSTNLSLGIELEIPAKIEKDGVLAVKGTTIATLLGTLTKNETIFMEAISDNLKITTKSNTTLIKSYPHEDFPTIPHVSGSEVKIPVKYFVGGLQSVYYSASVSDIKPEISSVYVYPGEEGLVFVATDSFRLAEKKIRLKNLGNFEPIIIPYKNVMEIVRILDGYSDDITLTTSKNQISFATEGLYVTSRVIDGVFPDYKQIIPQGSETEIIVIKQELLQALKVSNIFSDKFNQITLEADPKQKKFLLYSKNADVGESTVTIPAALSGKSIEANLNYKYFLDCFQSIQQDSVSIKCTEASRPIVIQNVGDHSFTYLIMPMNR